MVWVEGAERELLGQVEGPGRLVVLEQQAVQQAQLLLPEVRWGQRVLNLRVWERGVVSRVVFPPAIKEGEVLAWAAGVVLAVPWDASESSPWIIKEAVNQVVVAEAVVAWAA